MATPTRDQILVVIKDSPGITSIAIAKVFAQDVKKDEFDRTYHCVRVKLSVLAKRGEIHRGDAHIPGMPAEWYPGESA